MFNILDFIDSKDIREHNQNTQFTPIEQAYLIYYSRRTTIDEKLAAWHELLDSYNEEDFELTRFGKTQFYEDRSNRQILLDMVAVYENTLALRDCSEGVVFQAAYPGSANHIYFPDYSSALNYLKERKDDLDDDRQLYEDVVGPWPNAAITTEIRAYSYGKNDWFSNVFHFDKDLRLIHLWPDRELFVSDRGTLRYLLIYVPTPFKKGDIVRLISSEVHEYGILEEVPDEAYYALHSKDKCPEAGNNLRVLKFRDDDAHGHFDFRYCMNLELETCQAEDLPENQQILGFLSSVYKGQVQLGDFLHSYSYHGKEADVF